MNFLSGEELKHHIEQGLITNEDPDALIEDIKFPIRYAGEFEIQTEEGTETRDEPNLTIPPLEHRTLRTKERINTSYLGKTSPIRIVGFVKPRHSFIRGGVIPGDQGVIDTSWQGNDPLRVQLMNFNLDKALAIEEGEKIGYVYFNYITTTSELSADQLKQGETARSGPPLIEAKSSLEQRLDTLETQVENLSALESRVTQLEKRLEERIENLEERTEGLEGSHASINDDLQDLKNKI